MKTLLVLLLLIPFGVQTQTSFTLEWTPNPPVEEIDHYTVYRSVEQDANYTVLATTTDTFYTDVTVPDDIRVWYKLTATRGYLESGFSNWVSGRSIDLTEGQFNTELIHSYYPDMDERVLLCIWPPADGCYIHYWQFMVPDVINVRCDPPVYSGPAPKIQ